MHWCNYIDERRRHNLLKILEELSKLQDKREPQFILIGALSLLIHGLLHYVVYWDVDLLFRDNDALFRFINRKKTPNLRIFHYDDELMKGKYISSIHTAWSFDRTWFNVDYILKDGLFDFYLSTLKDGNSHTERIELNSSKYNLNLIIAHPWDVFTEKMTSPRLEKELKHHDTLSVDIRHVLTIIKHDKEDGKFWAHVIHKAKSVGKLAEFRRNLLDVIAHRDEFGYSDLKLSNNALTIIKSL